MIFSAKDPIRRRLAPLLLGFLLVGVTLFAISKRGSDPTSGPGSSEPGSSGLANSKASTQSATTASASRATASNSGSGPETGTKPESPAHNRHPEPAARTPIEKFVQMESLKVGRPDSDPEKSFRRLKRVAKKLRRLDFEDLKTTALNSAINNDRRFLSVYLMSLTDNAEALPALNAIALSPITVQDISSRLYAEELVLRTQALQGISQHREGRGLLSDYLVRQDNSFLADQARRLLHESP